MKFRFINITFFIGVHLVCFGQGRFSPDLTVAFQTGDYVLERAIFYSDEDAGDRTAGFSLVEASFKNQSYQAYQKFFAEGECHVTAETFNSWKEGVGQYAPVVKANFIVSKGDQTYGITQYILSYDGKEFPVGQMHKKVNGKWYYPGREENIRMQDLNQFMSLIRKDFFEKLEKTPEPYMQNEKLFTPDGKLKGGQFMLSYFDKYRDDAPLQDELNLLFADRIRMTDMQRTPYNAELLTYFKKADLSKSDLDYLTNLLKASQVMNAIAHFSTITNISFEKLMEECPKALHP